MAAPDLSPALRRRGITGAIACVAVFAFTIGLTVPLVSLILDRDGWDATTIGLNAATYAIAMLVVSPVAPWLARIVGTARLMALSLTVTGISIILFPIFTDLAVWFVLRFVMGLSVSILFIVSEAWINEVAEDRTRGRVVGLYTSVLAAGYASGPLVIPFTGIDGFLPFLVAVVVVTSAAIPLLWSASAAPTFHGSVSMPVLTFLRAVPLLLAALVVIGVVFGACEALLPVYAVREGQSTAIAALMLSVFVFGNTALQYPLGWLADRSDRETLLILCGAGTFLGCLLLPVLIHTLWLWPVLFAWGGVTLGLYTMAMTLLGERFTGSDLVVGGAVFSVGYGSGSMIGPIIAGGAMDIWGPVGMPLVLAAASALFVIAATMRRRAAAAFGG